MSQPQCALLDRHRAGERVGLIDKERAGSSFHNRCRTREERIPGLALRLRATRDRDRDHGVGQGGQSRDAVLILLLVFDAPVEHDQKGAARGRGPAGIARPGRRGLSPEAVEARGIGVREFVGGEVVVLARIADERIDEQWVRAADSGRCDRRRRRSTIDHADRARRDGERVEWARGRVPVGEWRREM